MNNRYDAFVSYNTDDVNDVRKIVTQLQQRGELSLFMDIDIEPGKNWVEILAEKILYAETFLFFIRKSPTKWQLEELQIAIRQQVITGKPFIIPVLLPNIDKDAFLGNPKLAFISKNQVAQFIQNSLELDIIDSLIRSIQGNSHVYISNRAMPRKDKLPSGFKADLGKLTELLIGESVYNTKTICIRELIQNARDACSRKVEYLRVEERTPEIILNIDEQNRFFEVIDFGDGMSPDVLNSSFSVLGRSLNDNYHNEDIDKQDISIPITGKFGIGFISTFMIAEKILVSTKAESFPLYHFSINSPKEPFEYSEISECNRKTNDSGTTIRVNLLSRYFHKNENINVAKIIEFYCRHVPDLFISQKNKKVSIDSDWNYEEKNNIFVINKTEKYEIRLSWASKEYNSIKLSNGGFYVQDLDSNILGDFPKGIVSGEINISPGLVDLNISRDKIVNNEKIHVLREVITKTVNDFFELVITFLSNLEQVDDYNDIENICKRLRQISSIAISTQNNNSIGMIKINKNIDFFKLYKLSFIHYVSIVGSKNNEYTVSQLKKMLIQNKLKIIYAQEFYKGKHFSLGKIFFDYITIDTGYYHAQLKNSQVKIKEYTILKRSMNNVMSREDATWYYYNPFTCSGLLKNLNIKKNPGYKVRKKDYCTTIFYVVLSVVVFTLLYKSFS